MKIIDYSETKTCETNLLKITLYLENNISLDDIKLLARDNALIYNEKMELPYFKIIAQHYTIRGAINTKHVTIDFNISDKEQCKIYLNEILYQ